MVRILDGFVIDNEKAESIAGILLDLYERGHELTWMSEYVLPRNLTPGSRERAFYFAYVIAIDYLTDSRGCGVTRRRLASTILGCSLPKLSERLRWSPLTILFRLFGQSSRVGRRKHG